MELDNGTHLASSSVANISLSASDALLWSALPELKLNIAQTATLCGISVRQLGYWTKQGYVTAVGRGDRRLYDLSALRRILGIRLAMQNGASLRQALRGTTPLDPAVTHALIHAPAEVATLSTHTLIPPQTANTISLLLLSFFRTNRHSRDNAEGLAIKLGRSEEHVRLVAERLCVDGSLAKANTQGETIFLHPQELAT
jgi:hypothetical protein